MHPKGTWADQRVSPNVSPGLDLADEIPETVVVEYCLSASTEEHCSVQFSIVIMAIVVTVNAIKAVCMLLTLKIQKHAPLVTLGDAIQSFLDLNDPATASHCLSNKKNFTKHRWGADAVGWKRQRHFWYESASKARFMICICLYVSHLPS